MGLFRQGITRAMGISRDSTHKRRKTGGRHPIVRKKRKFELGRPPSNTKLGPRKVHEVRTRGGNKKMRALRLDQGSFSWASEGRTFMTRILDVIYNASSNEMVRTKTLVKNCLVSIDANPVRTWYKTRYDVELSSKRAKDEAATATSTAKAKKAKKAPVLQQALAEQFNSGRLMACISSRPGQSGRVSGYILEGKELEFYLRKLSKKKH